MLWYDGHWVFWQAALAWLVMIAFLVFVIGAVYYVVSAGFRGSRRHNDDDSAKRILDERLARGEIDVDEYRRLREAIDSPSSRDAESRR